MAVVEPRPQLAHPAVDLAAVGGDLERLYVEHGDRVRAICASILRNRQEAEDAAQQVFVSALRALRSGDGAPRSGCVAGHDRAPGELGPDLLPGWRSAVRRARGRDQRRPGDDRRTPHGARSCLADDRRASVLPAGGVAAARSARARLRRARRRSSPQPCVGPLAPEPRSKDAAPAAREGRRRAHRRPMVERVRPSVR